MYALQTISKLMTDFEYTSSPRFLCIQLNVCNGRIQNLPNNIADVPVHTPISHCNVLNLTASNCVLAWLNSVSILVSVSLIFNSCTLLSSRILPFSRFKSNRTFACVRVISSRKRERNLSISEVNRSYWFVVCKISDFSRVDRSWRSLAKSTFSIRVK